MSEHWDWFISVVNARLLTGGCAHFLAVVVLHGEHLDDGRRVLLCAATRPCEWTIEGDEWTIEGDACTIEGDVWTIEGDAWTIEGDAWTIEGDEWTIEGDVWTIEGDEWTIEGDAWTIEGPTQGDEWTIEGLTWTLKAVDSTDGGGEEAGALRGTVRGDDIPHDVRLRPPRVVRDGHRACRHVLHLPLGIKHILTTDQSYTGSAGIFSRRTNQTLSGPSLSKPLPHGDAEVFVEHGVEPGGEMQYMI
eukprot:1192409-Prorocentrum_minimum.AAC.1